MTFTKVKYRDWEFEVDHNLTQQAYKNISVSGVENYLCIYFA